MAKPNTIHTLTVHALSHEGRGIGTLEKTVFMDNALPGEEVKIKILKQHSRFDEAEVLEILKPSPERIEPGCPHFHICGGCSLQHMDTAAQLQLKQKNFLEQLKHFGNLVPEEILEPLSADLWGYRRKARVGVKYVRKKE